MTELGYAIAPERRGRGIATALVASSWPVLARRAQPLCAHTLPEASASTTVLRRNGFAYAGDSVDPDEGVVWRWASSVSLCAHPRRDSR